MTINSIDLPAENKCVSGYHLGYLLNNPSVAEELKADLAAIFDLYRDGKIKIKVDSTYAFSRIGDAMKRMHARLNVGKIILKPDSEMPADALLPATTEQVNIQTSDQPLLKGKVERKASESKKNKKDKKAETEPKSPIIDEITPSSPVVAETTPKSPTTNGVEKVVVATPVEKEKVNDIVEDGTVPLTA